MGLRIAVPSDDGQALCQHFGRAQGFTVVEVDGDLPQAAEYRRRAAANALLALGAAPVDPHDRLAALLGDCQVVVAGGMGAPMARALRQLGLEVVSSRQDSVLAAVQEYLQSAPTERRAPDCGTPHEHHEHHHGEAGCGCDCHGS
ncbi:MAG: hypothetical protein IT204_24400 [Fimbriimonadaceae bacterium]|nr:hypothetical protein [Fimbriimonadaceae bacterium]